MTSQTTSEQILPETFEKLIDEHITWSQNGMVSCQLLLFSAFGQIFSQKSN